MRRRLKAPYSEPVQSQVKAGALPASDFDLGAPLVGEAKQIATEWVELQCCLDHHAEPVDTEPDVDQLLGEMDRDPTRHRRAHRRWVPSQLWWESIVA